MHCIWVYFVYYCYECNIFNRFETCFTSKLRLLKCDALILLPVEFINVTARLVFSIECFLQHIIGFSGSVIGIFRDLLNLICICFMSANSQKNSVKEYLVLCHIITLNETTRLTFLTVYGLPLPEASYCLDLQRLWVFWCPMEMKIEKSF